VIPLSCIAKNIKVKKRKNSVHRGRVLWDWVSHKNQIKFSDLYLANNSQFRGITFILQRALEILVAFARNVKVDLSLSTILIWDLAISKML
jgi:hypothetical protein